MNNHGGARRGAGRPRKWDFDVIVRIGQACEGRQRDAIQKAVNAVLAKRYNEDSDLAAQWAKAKIIPVPDRGKWLDSDDAEMYIFDVKVELLALDNTEDVTMPPVRVIPIRTRLPHGEREQIIAAVANEFMLSEPQVDKLWQRYRKIETEFSKGAIPTET